MTQRLPDTLPQCSGPLGEVGCGPKPIGTLPQQPAIAGGTKKTAEDMQVSHTNELEGGRRHYSIGRIKASCPWRAVNAHGDEADRLAAIQALIREAQEYDADAIVGLDFEVDGIKRADFDGTHLQRIAATGIAVKFAEAA
jgi:hypothetical protein